MSENKLLFLKNEITNNNGFKKTRGFKPQEETDELEEPRSITPLRKLRLRTANAQFFTEKRQRDDQRTIENLETIDLLQIRFYTTFNVDLQKKFLQRYGLSVVEYSDFNRTVLFEVVSRIQFRTFSDHLQEMVSSPDGESYEGKPYNLLALVHNFHFFTSSSRLQTTSTYGLLMCLISSVNGAYTRQKRSLFQYLEARKPI